MKGRASINRPVGRSVSKFVYSGTRFCDCGPIGTVKSILIRNSFTISGANQDKGDNGVHEGVISS